MYRQFGLIGKRCKIQCQLKFKQTIIKRDFRKISITENFDNKMLQFSTYSIAKGINVAISNHRYINNNNNTHTHTVQ